MKKNLHVEFSTSIAKKLTGCYDRGLEVMRMVKDRTKNVPYIEGLPYKLNETARISELTARNFYKNYVMQKSILELDEFQLLSHIIYKPDLSQSDLAKLVYKGKAHIGKILTEMEEKGYITRSVSTHNNMMVKHTSLTEHGKKLYDETDDAFKQLGRVVMESFTDEEVDNFMYLLEKFKNRLLENNEIIF